MYETRKGSLAPEILQEEVFLSFHLFSHKGSQRTDKVRRDLWKPASLTLTPLKQGQLEQGAQDQVQSSFQHLRGRRLHKSP